MGLGVSLLLIAGGAILIWGLQSDVAGISEDAIGVILIVIGALGLILSMLFWSSWGGSGRGRRRNYYGDVREGTHQEAEAGALPGDPDVPYEDSNRS
jgi:hypothetical protein